MPIGHFRNYERFREPDFALDRTNSHYKKTRAMKEIEQELLRKRGEAKSQGRQRFAGAELPSASDAAPAPDLEAMVRSVKRKAELLDSRRSHTKRRDV